MLLPDTMELRICVPYNSRSTAWASFDGRGRVELKQGDHIKVTASRYPFPTVCADKQSTDWFHAISRTLKWNERERQKSFVMVEESPIKTSSSRRATTGPGVDAASKSSPLEKHEEEKEDGEGDKDEKSDDDDEDEEEEKFDIDDSSTTASNQGASVPQSTAPSRTASGTTTPARIRVEKADLSMTSIPVNAPESPVVHTHNKDQEGRGQGNRQIAAEESSDINHHDDGERDNIHSPRSLLHGSRSKIPKDRDVDSMLTPRALDHDQTPSVSPNANASHQHHHHNQHHHNHRHAPQLQHIQLANLINPLQQARFALASARPRGRGHRHSRSDDLGTGNRAFAVWGQDESDSNTDSEH
jgi:NAD+ kinase